MDLTPTPEQVLLVESARGLLAKRSPTSAVRVLEAQGRGFDPNLWREIARLGWTGLEVSPALGGAGAGFVEVVLLAEEMGRVLLPSPFVPTVAMASWLIQTVGDAAQRRRWLPGIATGEIVATVAIAEPDARSLWDAPALTPVGGRLSGRKCLVPFAADSQLLLIAAADASLVAVEHDAPGLTLRPRHTFGGEPAWEARFENTPCELVGRGGFPSALDRGAVATLAYWVGACERMLLMSVDYARTREQFGRPIGSFQAIAHRCVDMRSDVDALRVLVHQAAWCLATGRSCDVEVGSALAYGLDAVRRVALHAHQVHGAIGFSMEHDLQLFTRRAKAAELTWGPAGLHYERVARAMGLG
jgi:alkylation response protein AidB-like acyl-CoA dehydrogenase